MLKKIAHFLFFFLIFFVLGLFANNNILAVCDFEFTMKNPEASLEKSSFLLKIKNNLLSFQTHYFWVNFLKAQKEHHGGWADFLDRIRTEKERRGLWY